MASLGSSPVEKKRDSGAAAVVACPETATTAMGCVAFAWASAKPVGKDHAMKKLFVLTITATVMMLGAPIKTDAAGDWEFRVAPFLWTAGISGEIGPVAMPASVDVDDKGDFVYDAKQDGLLFGVGYTF